jgi:hypothetical protein
MCKLIKHNFICGASVANLAKALQKIALAERFATLKIFST